MDQLRVVEGETNTNKVLFSSTDMQKFKIGAMEPLLVGDAVLAAYPGSVPAGKAMVAKQNFGDGSVISRLTQPLYMAKSIQIDGLTNMQLAALKDVLLRQKFVSDGQRFQFKFLDQLLDIKLQVTPDKDALPWLPIGMHEYKEVSSVAVVVNLKTEVVGLVAKVPEVAQKLGGLSKEYKTVYDAIDLPLRHPEVYKMYGMQATKGILLHGSPGTGKTMLVRTVARNIGCNLVIITAADISSKYQGETESKLRLLFEQAYENGPSIVFIDEIDTLCPKREETTDETQKKLVTSLLTLMDGIDTKSDKHVVIVGATNRPNTLDPALRRPGRFEKEIEIGVPSSQDRLEILKLYLDQMPTSLTDNQILEISDGLHGYVGADIAGMCREAGSLAMQRHLKSPSFPLPEHHKVNYVDLLHAKNQVKASAMREVSIEVPRVQWSDVGGHSQIKRKLQESVEWPVKNPEVFARLGIDPPKGVLLYGPPGCSKTLLAKAVATESKLNFFAIKGSELFSKWVGESERAVREVFRKATAASPSIIFFDEIDALASSRSDGSTSVSERVLTALLTEMDGIEPLVNVIVIAATNRPDILDPALMRPGRLDRLLYVAPPDYDARLEIFRLKTQKMPLHDVDMAHLAEQSDGYSGAEIVAICQEAALCAMKNFDLGDLEQLKVTAQDFAAAIQQTAPRITNEQLKYYETFNKR